jgi:protein-L-isoaspartate(D-aspartate) O-methyltransferase
MRQINFEQARIDMVERQIRTWEVLDQQVLEVIAATPREDYVPAAYRNLAYADINIPLGHGQVMMAPKVEGRILQSLGLHAQDKVLEVGTGSGYLTALLAQLAAHVYSVEIVPAFKLQAEEKLAAHGLHNTTLAVGDAARGWPQHAPYDVIVVTGSLPRLVQAFGASLTIGGRLFVVVGTSPVMEALLITRESEQAWRQESLFETDLPPLLNAPQEQRFTL